MIREEMRRALVFSKDYYTGKPQRRWSRKRVFVHDGCDIGHEKQKTAKECADKLARKVEKATLF